MKKTILSFVALMVVAVSANAEKFKQFSAALEEGDYVITYTANKVTYAMKAGLASSRFTYSEVTPEGGVLEDPSADIVWHIAKSGEYWTIYNESIGQYAGGNGTKNKGAFYEEVSDNSLWTATGSYEFINKYNQSKNVNANLRNNATYGFACYATSTGGALTLYKKVKADELVAPTLSPTGGEFYKAQVVSITADATADVYYSFDGALFQKYVSPLVISEDATVYAYAQKGDKKSSVASAKYVIAKKYATFEDLTKVTPANQPVIVSFENKEIVELYYTSSGKCNGVYIMSGDTKYEIYCYNVPEEWEVGGFISGTIQGKWQEYKGTWEVCPSSWDGITYKAPAAPEIKPVAVQSYKPEQESGIMAWVSQESCAAMAKYLLLSSVDDLEIHAVMPDGTVDESTDGLGTTNGWRDAAGDWCEEGTALFYSRPVVEFLDGVYYFGTNMGTTDAAVEGMVFSTPFVFINKTNGRGVTVMFTMKKIAVPVYALVKKSSQILKVNRTVGLGKAETKAAYDTDAVCSALGINDINDAEIYGINSSVAWDIAPVKWIENPMASFEGWRNGNGDFCQASDADASVCVKVLKQATDNIIISTKATKEPKVSDPIFNAYYVFAANQKAVLVLTQITFVDENGDGATGVQTLSEVRSEELGVRSYNLSGQVVDDTYKGIVIKNGKKAFRR